MEGETWGVGGWGGGSQVAPVNPSLIDPRGVHVTQQDNASRCGPDDYEGFRGWAHLKGLIRVSNGGKVVTPAGKKSPRSVALSKKQSRSLVALATSSV